MSRGRTRARGPSWTESTGRFGESLPRELAITSSGRAARGAFRKRRDGDVVGVEICRVTDDRDWARCASRACSVEDAEGRRDKRACIAVASE